MPTGLSEEAAVIIQKQKNLRLQFNINELKELRAENEDLKKTIAINKNIISQLLSGDQADVLKTVEESVYTLQN